MKISKENAYGPRKTKSSMRKRENPRFLAVKVSPYVAKSRLVSPCVAWRKKYFFASEMGWTRRGAGVWICRSYGAWMVMMRVTTNMPRLWRLDLGETEETLPPMRRLTPHNAA
jgi:hypothetical protein